MSPRAIILGVENGESYIASDVPAILKYTRNVYYIGNLEDAICNELLNTGKTIQEIAYEYQFSSQAHFTKFFKRITGYTPSNYRKNHIQ